jgi:hypothetical protein
MDHKNEEWSVIQENSLMLNNLMKLILKIERQQERDAERMDELQKTVQDIQQKMITQDHRVEIDRMKIEIENSNKTLMENREIFTKVMDNFIKYENNEIKPRLDQITCVGNALILPSFEKTIEQNRLWRLYSNNFRQNSAANTSNLATQMTLL